MTNVEPVLGQVPLAETTVLRPVLFSRIAEIQAILAEEAI